jgi:hypothetical protein
MNEMPRRVDHCEEKDMTKFEVQNKSPYRYLPFRLYCGFEAILIQVHWRVLVLFVDVHDGVKSYPMPVNRT